MSEHRLRVLIMPRKDAEAHAPDGREVCISITSPGDGLADLSSHFRDVLRVSFHDLAGFQRADGSYPPGAVQSDEAMADEIAAFALRNRDADRIVVHCTAGISRSVAVGLAISTTLSRYWAWPSYMPLEYRQARYVHNRAVFDLVVAAIQRAQVPA